MAVAPEYLEALNRQTKEVLNEAIGHGASVPSAEVVVTQAGSFLGLHIIRELLTLKAYIRAVVSSQDDVDAVTDTFPNHALKATQTLKPAIEGSLSIMQSAFEAHCLEKVVLISSATALGDWSLPPTELNYNVRSPDISRDQATVIREKPSVAKLFAACNALGERACWKHWERGRRLDEHPFEMTSLLPVNMCGPEVVPRAMRDDNLKLYYATQGFVPVEDSISFWVDVRDVGITTCEALFTDVASSNGKRYVMSAAQVLMSELAAMIRFECGILMPNLDVSSPHSPTAGPAFERLKGKVREVRKEGGTGEMEVESEPATPADTHKLANLDVTASIHDLGVSYGNISFAAREAFAQLQDTEWGDMLGLANTKPHACE